MYLVSAIITTYKRDPRIVERALNSIFNQTYNNIEIIVVDDSPVEFEQRIEVEQLINRVSTNSPFKIKLIINEKTCGACASRNIGLKESKGQIIGYLDDDDEWCPNKIESMVHMFDNPKIGLVYSNYYEMNDDSHILKTIKLKNFCDNPYEHLIRSNFIGGTSFPLLRKCAVISAGSFDEEMLSAQDYDLWLRLAKVSELTYVDEYLSIYHIHNNDQISKNHLKRILGLERIIQKNIDYLEKNFGSYHIRLMRIIPHYASERMICKAFKTWCKAVSIKPFSIFTNIKYFLVIIKKILTNKQSTIR